MIRKGFLNRSVTIQLDILLSGIILWATYAYVFYWFLLVYRELFRFLTSQLGDQAFLVLSPHENYLHNLFFASLASALGFAFGLRFVLQVLPANDLRLKRRIRRTLNIEGFYTWSFLFWFAKVGFITGIFYTLYALQFELDLLKEFPYFFLLLPVVLFYSSWPALSKLMGPKKWQRFILLTGIYLLMSFVLSLRNLVNSEALNEKVLNHSIEHVFNLEVPESQSYERLQNDYSVIDIYVVRDTLDSSNLVVFIEDITHRVSLNDLERDLLIDRGRIANPYKNLVANLHVDKEIKMAFVDAVEYELRKAGLNAVNYSTGVPHSRYPPEFPGFKRVGIFKQLYPFSASLEHFLDSVGNIELRGKEMHFSNPEIYRHITLKQFNRIKIRVTQDSVMINNQPVDSAMLSLITGRYIEKYAPQGFIIYEYDPNISYGRYISMVGQIRAQYDRLRNELSYEMLNKPYEPRRFEHLPSEFDTVRNHFPINLLEWTEEEKRLHALIEKMEEANRK